MLCTDAVDSSEATRWLFDPTGIWVVPKPFTFDDVLAAIAAALDDPTPETPGAWTSISPNGSTDRPPDQD